MALASNIEDLPTQNRGAGTWYVGEGYSGYLPGNVCTQEVSKEDKREKRR